MQKFVKLLFIINLIIISNVQNTNGKLLKIKFLNVTDGNAIFITTPNNYKILIGGGPASQANDKIIPFLKSNNIQRIDSLILPNINKKNIGAALNLIDHMGFDIGYIVYFDFDIETQIFEDILFKIMAKQNKTSLSRDKSIADTLNSIVHYEILNPKGGDILNWDMDLTIQVLSPRITYRNTRSDINNNSLVIKINYNIHSFLFTGDIEREAEIDLARQGTKLVSSIIEVPQNGNSYSSSSAFIKKASPKYAVLQTSSQNKFTSEIINRYKIVRPDIEFYRTDINGDIEIISDGKADIIIKPEK